MRKRKPVKTRLLNGMKVAPSGCWEWQKSRFVTGYAQIRIDGRACRAHREAYRAFVGEIPEGKQVNHTCDNRRCINPEHLYAGTQRQNLQDMLDRGRANWNPGRGEDGSGAKLNEMQARIIRRLHSLGGWYYREIGELFGVSTATIHAIVKGVTWKHLTLPKH